MIRAKIYIEKYDWEVFCYISVTHYATNEILANLRRIGCKEDIYLSAKEKLNRGEINGGLTYTSYRTKQTVMVTSIADSAAEQLNTITHEIAHVCALYRNGVVLIWRGKSLLILSETSLCAYSQK